MNELLRRFLLQAGLREDDVAARLGVDPKTVRRWLNGRVPYPHNRAAIADLLGAEEADLWPGASGTLTARIRPDELRSVYPHRLAVPREVWIAVLWLGRGARSASWPTARCSSPKTQGFSVLLAEKGHAGVNIRIALGDPESSTCRPTRRRRHRGCRARQDPKGAHAVPVGGRAGERRRSACTRRCLYNSIYRADDQLIVNQHAYGIPAAHAPVFCLRDIGGGEMTALYRDSFERVWATAVPLA